MSTTLSAHRRARAIGLRPTLVAVATMAAFGCASTRDASVTAWQVRGPYIDATLALPSGESRFFFPDTEICAEVITSGAPVRYSKHGHFGRVKGAHDEVCDPIGIGTLSRWRRTRQAGDMAPSSPANWSIIHEDPQVLLLRGRFPLASRVGVPNTFDVVAVVPNDAVCEPIARSGSANLVFRQAGSRVLALGQCPVLGVAMAQ